MSSLPEVGGGHVRRCLALADALRARVDEIRFVLDPGATWAGRLTQRGYRSAIDAGGPPERSAATVLDGYHFGTPDLGRWRAASAFLALVDDFGRAYDGVDFLLRPGARSSFADKQVAQGFEYALLDADFARAPRPVVATPAQLLVTFGLRDSMNGTGLALRALAQLPAALLPTVTVVMGSEAPHLADVRALVTAGQVPATLRTDVSDMAPLLRGSDLVIGSGGVSLLERMACGVPSLTIATATNQVRNADAAGRAGGTIFLGMQEDASPRQIAAAVEHLLGDATARRTMAERARSLVDGRGADRAAAALLAASVSNA